MFILRMALAPPVDLVAVLAMLVGLGAVAGIRLEKGGIRGRRGSVGFEINVLAEVDMACFLGLEDVFLGDRRIL